MPDFARILCQIDPGNNHAAEQLLPLVYDELRRLASARLAQEQPGQTLQATGLVHEAWLRLAAADPEHRWNSRNHFFAAAAEAMRRILVDRARQKGSQKRDGGRRQLLESDIAAAAPSEEVLAVHEALDALQAADSLAAQLVKLHYFGGFSLEEAAEPLGMSRATAYRMWTYARAWLRAYLNSADDSG